MTKTKTPAHNVDGPTMTTADQISALRLAIAEANAAGKPDPGLYLALADRLEEDGQWIRDLPSYRQPPGEARLTSAMIRFSDERTHGVGPCPNCNGNQDWVERCYTRDNDYSELPCSICYGTGTVPTFADLLDREENADADTDVGTCRRRFVIHGTMSALAATLRTLGHPEAEWVGGLKVEEFGPQGGLWRIVFSSLLSAMIWSANYPDTCRVLIRVVVERLTEPCYKAGTDVEPCDKCLALGWRLRQPAG